MSDAALETMWLVIAVAAACAVPGVFLVLRRLALIADAISHVLLFGIVIMYFIVRDLDSPWLALGATASGVLTVALVELLHRTKLVQEDAAIGLVFPALFAIGTILASMYFRGTHLDIDQVLLGHAELVRFTRAIEIAGVPLGRLPTIIMGGMFALNVGLVVAFYKELKLSTFDPALAATFGFLPWLLHYGLMTVVSVTTVAAFDAVGPILVVAFLVVPAATAILLVERLHWVLAVAVADAVLAAVSGVFLAFELKTNTAGTVATVLGAIFGVTFFVAPNRGLIAQVYRRFRQRREFFATMLTIHLLQHEGTPAEPDEAREDGLYRHLHWTPNEVAGVVRRALGEELIERKELLLQLTEAGRVRARSVLNL